ncbi:MAG TPA: DUF3179 domain-containing (seleno)protein [Pirellulaceae bacterium]|nr:DUF3179 domain-containing (seleno)protein [Pirellulaceae bacterium]
MRFSVAAGAACALVVLIAVTMYFAPPPPEKVDKTKVPDEIPFVLAGSGVGADENATEIVSLPVAGVTSTSIPAWNLSIPFEIESSATTVLPPAPATRFDIGEVDGKFENDGIVLGVVQNGEARAYATALFGDGDSCVLNETLGGDPVAVSLCPSSGSAVAVVRKHNGIELTFADRGVRWRGNAVWQDLETESMWSQLLARAVTGQLADSSLEVIPVAVTTWEKWRQAHPQSSLVIANRPSGEVPTKNWLASDIDYGVGIRVLDENIFYTLSDFTRAPLRRDEPKLTPVAIVYYPNTGIVYAYQRMRAIQDFEVTEQGQFVDRISATTWDLTTGIAIAGRERGTQLEPVRYQWCSRTGWETFFQSP